MKIQDAKDLLQNLLFTNKSNKLNRKEIMDKYPLLVLKSREANENGIHVYRVLKLMEGSEIKKFADSESTTTSIRSAMQISDAMPSMLNTDEGMKTLESHIFSFKVQSKDVLLDMSVVLPILKDKLKNHMEKNIENNAFGDKLKIKEAFEEIEYANEKEILVDLRKLDKKHINLKREAGFSFLCNLSQIEKGRERITYEEDLSKQYNLIKSILSDEDNEMIVGFAKKAEIKLVLNQEKRIKSNKLKNK